MPISAASAIAFGLYFLMGLGVFAENPKSAKHRAFLYLNLFFAAWSLPMAFAYSCAGSDWLFWYRLSSIGWIFVPAAALYFFLYLTGNKRTAYHPGFMLILFLIPLLFWVRALTGNLMATSFAAGPFGNVEVHGDRSLIYYIFSAYILAGFGSGLALVLRWGLRTPSRLERLQARWVFWAGIFSVTFGSVSCVLLPYIGNRVLPQAGQLFGLVWIFAIWFAMKKYRLLASNPEIALGEITRRIIDLIVLLDPEERILQVNRSVINVLGWKENELVGMHFNDFFYRNLRKETEEVPDIHEDGDRLVWEVNFLTRTGLTVPLNCYISPVNDGNGELAGFVFIAQDLRWYKDLEREFSEKTKAQEELRRTNEMLEQRVAERTRELENLATTDVLTGAYNRRMGLALLEKEIHHAKRDKTHCTVCFVDINDLKVVNDTWGHKEGDELIRQVAHTLRSSMRESDILARMGGDEFLVVLNGCNLDNAILAWATLQKRVNGIQELTGKPWKASVSHGFAEFQPESTATVEELIAIADHAMYQNKKAQKAGRSRHAGERS